MCPLLPLCVPVFGFFFRQNEIKKKTEWGELPTNIKLEKIAMIGQCRVVEWGRHSSGDGQVNALLLSRIRGVDIGQLDTMKTVRLLCLIPLLSHCAQSHSQLKSLLQAALEKHLPVAAARRERRQVQSAEAGAVMYLPLGGKTNVRCSGCQVSPVLISSFQVSHSSRRCSRKYCSDDLPSNIHEHPLDCGEHQQQPEQ